VHSRTETLTDFSGSIDKLNKFYELAKRYDSFETIKDCGDTRPLSNWN
jgi:hypothetical protein